MSALDTLVLWCYGEGIDPTSFINTPKFINYMSKKDGVGVKEAILEHGKKFDGSFIYGHFSDPKVQIELLTIVRGSPVLFDR